MASVGVRRRLLLTMPAAAFILMMLLMDLPPEMPREKPARPRKG
jgi:hypothetical protein